MMMSSQIMKKIHSFSRKLSGREFLQCSATSALDNHLEANKRQVEIFMFLHFSCVSPSRVRIELHVIATEWPQLEIGLSHVGKCETKIVLLRRTFKLPLPPHFLALFVCILHQCEQIQKTFISSLCHFCVILRAWDVDAGVTATLGSEFIIDEYFTSMAGKNPVKI